MSLTQREVLWRRFHQTNDRPAPTRRISLRVTLSAYASEAYHASRRQLVNLGAALPLIVLIVTTSVFKEVDVANPRLPMWQPAISVFCRLLVLACGLMMAVRLVPSQSFLPIVPSTISPRRTTAALHVAPLPLAIEAATKNNNIMPSAHFVAHGSHGEVIWFSPHEVILGLPGAFPSVHELTGDGDKLVTPEQTQVRWSFVNANQTPEIIGRLPGVIHRYFGNDPAHWRTNVATYAGVQYRDLYNGIDLHVEVHDETLKGTFTVAPRADPRQIRWRYSSGSNIRLNQTTGALSIDLPGGRSALVDTPPIAWQERDGWRIPVAVRYVLEDSVTPTRERVSDSGAGSLFGFTLGQYDPTLPLTIDPLLTYGTYLGGGGDDLGQRVVVGIDGSIYLIGTTQSVNLPLTGSMKHPYSGGQDAFIAKFTPDGQSLVYATYLGGSGPEYGRGIALDSAGNVAVTGSTSSIDFPTLHPLQNSYGGNGDGFVAKLAADGTLVYSTYFGGSDTDVNNDVALDQDANIYLAGGNRAGAYIAKLAAVSGTVVYSTTISTISPRDVGTAIMVDANSVPYVTGNTFSGDCGIDACTHVFVAKVKADGSGVIYSLPLGQGQSQDYSDDITVDGQGNAYITGWTNSANFPTQNPLQPSLAGFTDAFVAKVKADGSGLIYSTYFGGSGRDYGNGIAVDSAGSVSIVGQTSSIDLHVVQPIQATNGGNDCDFPPCSDAFVASLAPDGSRLEFSTYLGGSAEDYANAIALDSDSRIYILGATKSINLPTVHALQVSNKGFYDMFVTRIQIPTQQMFVPLVSR